MFKRLLLVAGLTLCGVTATWGQDNYRKNCIDLGLSVNWATCNVGAKIYSERGTSYSWGDTRPYRRVYDFSEIKYCSDSHGERFSKYVTKPEYGTVDNKIVLELSDDAARKHWGENWRIPTKEECEELINKCKWTKKQYGRLECFEVTGPNGKSILITAGTSLWTSSLNLDSPSTAYVLFIGTYSKSIGPELRIKASCIRPVSDK